MNPPSSFATAILLAGGSGTRINEGASDKILLPILGKPVFQYSIEAFANCLTVDSIVVVYRDEAQRKEIEPLISSDAFREVLWTQGGPMRQDSVWSGLSQLSPNCETVLIHDGARPLITPAAIDAVGRAARESQAACIARKSTDTLKLVRNSNNGYTLQTLDRSRVWAMETPQGFQTSLIRKSYRDILKAGVEITDDLSAIEDSNLPVALIEISDPNPKLTTPQDIAYIEFVIQNRSPKANCPNA